MIKRPFHGFAFMRLAETVAPSNSETNTSIINSIHLIIHQINSL